MKKFKQGLAFVLAMVMVATAAVGGTIAYLTSEDSDVNVMTLGGVKIEQIEQERDEDGNLVNFTQAKPAYPAVYERSSIPWASDPKDYPVPDNEAWKVVEDNANVIDKFVTVKNTGKSDAYVRTIIAFEVGKDSVNDEYMHFVCNDSPATLWDFVWAVDAEGNDITIEIDGSVYCIGVFTYAEALKPGITTVPNVKQVYLDKTATNEVCEAYGETFEILVLSQAVQTAGFDKAETALDTAFGEVTAETAAEWFGGDEFEIPTVVATAEELTAALAEGKDVVLTKDIDLGETQVAIKAGEDVTINLNGNDITGTYEDEDHYAMFTVPNGASLTIEGEGEVKATTKALADNRSLALFLNSGELTINGGTYNVTDNSEGKTWIIATIVDNRTTNRSSNATLTINGGDFSVGGKAINLFRNYPQQGGIAKIIFNDGIFHGKADDEKTYIWNQESGTSLGELYFNGGSYDDNVVYEDYNGQSDIHIADGVEIEGYEGNN